MPRMQPFETPVAMDRTFDALYGLEIQEYDQERVVARVAVRDEVKQPMGLIHGGVYASMAEAMTSMATAAAVFEDGKAAMGLANSTSFLRPITSGEYVHAVATRRHKGRTTWVWDVDITDDAGKLCATTRMTIAVRDMPKG